MQNKINKIDALRYHEKGRPGKIEVNPTKPYRTQRDLALAYSPGVAEPCLAIQQTPSDAYRYTAKGNLVAVISNGTAVLGLGNIGAAAGKPVMEGKGLLFKIFADIDVFDIELDVSDVDGFVATVKAMAPTFGGINLEDIKAPECFEIERRLKAELDIPVMHDDQHGTAIISAAGLLNALHLNGKRIEDIKLVVNGAGAAAIACTNLYIALGVQAKNVVMCDSKGVINNHRAGLNEQKQQFVTERDISTLAEAMKGADMFLGLSVADVLTDEMVMSMAKDPIIFALANPNPEIAYDKAMALRSDVIMATGRSDYPNQINNVLGFPYIFRGALDVRATAINEEMKIACVRAIADLTQEAVPESVNVAYERKNIVFGKDYIVPKALDPRLITRVAVAVAKAAIDSGVAAYCISDWEAYKQDLNQRLGLDNKLLRTLNDKARQAPKKVVFAEGENYNVIKAATIVAQEQVAYPILLGNRQRILQIAEDNELDISKIPIVMPSHSENAVRRLQYAQQLCQKRGRQGITLKDAQDRMQNRHYFAAIMVEQGEADAMITGYNLKYQSAVRIIDEVIGKANGMVDYTGVNVMMSKRGPYFFADTTNGEANTVENIITATLSTAALAKRFNIEARIAILSHTNFGAGSDESSVKMREVVHCLHRDYPDMIVDGEMNVDFALDSKARDEAFPFTKLKNKEVNTLIFPNIESANMAYKLLKNLGEVESLGPVLLGAAKSVHIVPLGASVRDIVNMTMMAVVDAQ